MPHLQLYKKSVTKTIAWNTTSQLVARGVSSLTTFLITLVIARQFGAQGLGDFVKITTYIAFFYLIADFGINAIYLQRDASWEDLLVVRVCMSCVLIVVAMTTLFLLPHGESRGYTNFVRMGIILFSPSIIFQALTTTANALFQKHLRYDKSTIALASGSVLSVALLYIVTLQSEQSTGVLYAILSLLAGMAVTAATGLLLTRTFHRTDHSKISWPSIWGLFTASAPLGITLLFNLVYFRVDSIILTLTRSTSDVGVYGLAYKVFELFLVFPTFFMNSVYPIMVKSQNKEFTTTVRKSFIFLLLTSLFCILVFWIAAPIISWIRSDFAPGIQAARILSLGLPFFFLSSLAMWILIAKKKQMLLLKIYGISMIINIVLDVLFIPTYGYMAAAWITGICEAIVLAMSGASALQLLSL
jgi:O-antigen/teichoic acid export membrane protein